MIIPVVPLGLESSSFFYIINDGYENFTIKHSIQQEYGPIELEVVYIDGQVIGI